jgi:hypothetical protein
MLIVVMLSVVLLNGVEPYSQHLIIFVTYKWAQKARLFFLSDLSSLV